MSQDGEKGVIIQRDKQTYAVAPHIPCGVVKPHQRLGAMMEKMGFEQFKSAVLGDQKGLAIKGHPRKALRQV
ncbi:MAG TPA: hypothetical protein VMW16_10310 [Sedimentisphaerales bacterium]|nr:hypothetical protein [Sedimentisphaerales bacterium]